MTKNSLFSLIKDKHNPHKPKPSSNHTAQNDAFTELNRWAQTEGNKDFISLVHRMLETDKCLADFRYRWFIIYWLFRLQEGTLDQCLTKEKLTSCNHTLPSSAKWLVKLTQAIEPFAIKTA